MAQETAPMLNADELRALAENMDTRAEEMDAEDLSGYTEECAQGILDHRSALIRAKLALEELLAFE